MVSVSELLGEPSSLQKSRREVNGSVQNGHGSHRGRVSRRVTRLHSLSPVEREHLSRRQTDSRNEVTNRARPGEPNIGTAFQTPTTTELDNPNGPGFNPNLEPQTSVTYEIGGRAEGGDRFTAGFAATASTIDNELVPFESASAAHRLSQRRPLAPPRPRARLAGAAAGSAALDRRGHAARRQLPQLYRRRHLDSTATTSPAFPPWWIYQELAYSTRSGLFAAIEAFLVDGYFVNDANTASTDSYAAGQPARRLRAHVFSSTGRWRRSSA